MNDIYEVIKQIDLSVKRNRYYLNKDYHKGNFNFQDIYSSQYNQYTPYFVPRDTLPDILNEINIDFNLEKINTSKGSYLLLSNNSAEDRFYDNFLYEGIYLVTGFVSHNGHIVVAAYSKNFEPKIYEGLIHLPKIEGKNPFRIEEINTENSYRFQIDYEKENYEINLTFPDYLGEKNKLDKIINLNKNEKFIKPIQRFTPLLLIKELKTKDDFSWDNIFTCIDKISGIYFNDTDPNILNRADLICYLNKHVSRIQTEITTVSIEQKEAILALFRERQDFINLLPHAINLEENKFYKNFYLGEQNDYGAKNIATLCSFINLQLGLDNPKRTIKKQKI